ncbi:hypothetical protein AAT17_05725 [Nonlabens sp. MIC269]|uniref:universal stress protein n=1 Tax=Nonlabens sp. MIC269 TaxID=1476901 RepID=UPI00071EDB10|nr:universal stress protein [Nonlabens sp. MIC269]ALM20759.1 hypothetical protein AAT17_05725 [Nonlabens sp. MIC269]
MAKNILVATDFSSNSWHAFTYVSTLFKDETCMFHLLHAYDTEYHSRNELKQGNDASFTYESPKDKGDVLLNKMLEKIALECANEKHSYKTHLMHDDVATAITKTLSTENISLIVMGSKGITNYEKSVFGSNTIATMKEAGNCTILTVPHDSEVEEIKEIVFPTDYKSAYSSLRLQSLIDLATIQDAAICVLHVDTSSGLETAQEDNKQILDDALSNNRHSFHVLTGSDVNLAVKHFVESRDSSMVAIVNRKHNLFTSWFSTNMVMEIGKVSQVPLLILPE